MRRGCALKRAERRPKRRPDMPSTPMRNAFSAKKPLRMMSCFTRSSGLMAASAAALRALRFARLASRPNGSSRSAPASSPAASSSVSSSMPAHASKASFAHVGSCAALATGCGGARLPSNGTKGERGWPSSASFIASSALAFSPSSVELAVSPSRAICSCSVEAARSLPVGVSLGLHSSVSSASCTSGSVSSSRSPSTRSLPVADRSSLTEGPAAGCVASTAGVVAALGTAVPALAAAFSAFSRARRSAFSALARSFSSFSRALRSFLESLACSFVRTVMSDFMRAGTGTASSCSTWFFLRSFLLRRSFFAKPVSDEVDCVEGTAGCSPPPPCSTEATVWLRLSSSFILLLFELRRNFMRDLPLRFGSGVPSTEPGAVLSSEIRLSLARDWSLAEPSSSALAGSAFTALPFLRFVRPPRGDLSACVSSALVPPLMRLANVCTSDRLRLDRSNCCRSASLFASSALAAPSSSSTVALASATDTGSLSESVVETARGVPSPDSC
mmetsp:Transcript_22219/g.87542  ORF Transcript_22219/g.87542 Transcript_22219/m.87542 type:complete len:502 (-) Transcript_22219:427-1932(-)